MVLCHWAIMIIFPHTFFNFAVLSVSLYTCTMKLLYNFFWSAIFHLSLCHYNGSIILLQFLDALYFHDSFLPLIRLSLFNTFLICFSCTSMCLYNYSVLPLSYFFHVLKFSSCTFNVKCNKPKLCFGQVRC